MEMPRVQNNKGDALLMHDTHDVRKSMELDKQEHDREMLIDELERRVQRLEERVNMIEFYRRRE